MWLSVYRFANQQRCGYSVSQTCMLADGHNLLAWQCTHPHSLHAPEQDLLAAFASEALHGCTYSKHALAIGAHMVQGCCSEEEQNRSIWQTRISCHWSASPPRFGLSSELPCAVKAQCDACIQQGSAPKYMLCCAA